MRAAIALLALPAAACASFRPPSEQAQASAGCGAKALIEDGEDGDDQIIVRSGRGGYLYAYADDKGTTIEPRDMVTPVDGGADGSGRALRVRGKLATGEVYAGVGLSFREPVGAYDASRFTGVAFWAKRGPGAAGVVRLQIGDVSTDRNGGVCTECDNDFGITFDVTEEWTRYEVSFADLKQEGGWGAPRPAALDPAKLYGMKWQVATPGGEFDVWIDQIAFLCAE